MPAQIVWTVEFTQTTAILRCWKNRYTPPFKMGIEYKCRLSYPNCQGKWSLKVKICQEKTQFFVN